MVIEEIIISDGTFGYCKSGKSSVMINCEVCINAFCIFSCISVIVLKYVIYCICEYKWFPFRSNFFLVICDSWEFDR